jgi:hypothetical protein
MGGTAFRAFHDKERRAVKNICHLSRDAREHARNVLARVKNDLVLVDHATGRIIIAKKYFEYLENLVNVLHLDHCMSIAFKKSRFFESRASKIQKYRAEKIGYQSTNVVKSFVIRDRNEN